MPTTVLQAHGDFQTLQRPCSIPTGGGQDYAHHITACPPGSEKLTTSLGFKI